MVKKGDIAIFDCLLIRSNYKLRNDRPIQLAFLPLSRHHHRQHLREIQDERLSRPQLPRLQNMELRIQPPQIARPHHPKNQTQSHCASLRHWQRDGDRGRIDVAIIGGEHEGGARDRSSAEHKKIEGRVDHGDQYRGQGTTRYSFQHADFKIDMNRLCENRRALKPDNMTAVIYRLDEPIKKVMVYRSGKMLLWGAKTLEDVEMAYQMMRKQMLPYELSFKSDPYSTSDP